LLASLVDGLSTERIEIDMIDLSGPAFAAVDNRIMSLRLVQLGLTGAAMFAADGKVLQPSEVLRKRPLLVQRGRFRPVTHVNMDMLDLALKKFRETRVAEPDVALPIMEMSLQNLAENGDVCLEDFVSRAEVLATTGNIVMVSNFPEHYRLVAFLSRYTDRPIGLALGLGNLRNLFDAEYYRELDGGILESLGRLFKQQLTLFVYPLKNPASGRVENLDDLVLDGPLQHLFAYLRAQQSILPLEGAASRYLDIQSPDVLAKIRSGGEWLSSVPESVATAITQRSLFGYSRG
jgi:hypothetical protein